MKIKSIAMFTLLLSLAACGGSTHEEGHDHGSEDAHKHPAKGTHGGMLVELGEHVAHMECIHDDDAGTVSVFIVDEDLKPLALSKAPMLNIVVGDERKQLVAKKISSSDSEWRFEDAALKAEPETARFRIVLNGTTYSPDMPHDHGDDDHDHDGDDHDHDGDDHDGHDHDDH